MLNIFFQFLIELIFLNEIFKVDMHPVLPVIIGISGIVDPFFIRVFPA